MMVAVTKALRCQDNIYPVLINISSSTVDVVVRLSTDVTAIMLS